MTPSNEYELRRWLQVCRNKLRYPGPRVRMQFYRHWINEYHRTMEAIYG